MCLKMIWSNGRLSASLNWQTTSSKSINSTPSPKTKWLKWTLSLMTRWRSIRSIATCAIRELGRCRKRSWRINCQSWNRKGWFMSIILCFQSNNLSIILRLTATNFKTRSTPNSALSRKESKMKREREGTLIQICSLTSIHFWMN